MTDLRRALRVVAITESKRVRGSIVERTLLAVAGGATSVQVRLKDSTAREIADVTAELVRRSDVPVLVNDRFDIALATGAAGVHLGAEDIRPAIVRAHVPAGFIIGASAGCDAELQLADGADYVGIGPVFGTASKHDAGDAIGLGELGRLAAAARTMGLPAVAIGGIDAENAASAIRAGAAGVASISAIFGSGDPERAAAAMIRATET